MKFFFEWAVTQVEKVDQIGRMWKGKVFGSYCPAAVLF